MPSRADFHHVHQGTCHRRNLGKGAARVSRCSRPGLERLERRLVLSYWQEIPIPFDNPQATVLLSDGRLLVEQFASNHWYLISPDASGSYTEPKVEQAADSRYIHEYSGIALLKDGEVMVSGAEYPARGDSNYDPTTTGQDHIELYNPTLNSWREVAKPTFFGSSVIIDNSIKVLPDGRVLAGTGDSGLFGLYDPTTGTWMQTQSIPSGSANEVTLTMLADGRVLAVGTGKAANRSWVYDESTSTWTEVGKTPGALNSSEGGPMVQLPDGGIFAVGAVQHWATQTAIFSPSSQTWSQGPPVPNGSVGAPPRPGESLQLHSFRIVPRLASGLALEVPGGLTQDLTQTEVGAWNQADSQVWQFADAGGGYLRLNPVSAPLSALDDEYGGSADGNPVDLYHQNGTLSQEWKVAPTGDGYFTLSAASAPGDSLQVTGDGTTPGSLVELDTSNGSAAQEWQLIEDPNSSFGDEPIAALPSGHVLVGASRFDQTAFYEYDPVANTFSSVSGVPGPLAADPAVYAMNMTVLPSGQVLVTGAGGSHVFLYTPDGQPLEAWKPAILGLLPPATGSSAGWIVGWGLNGISEGGVFGDDNSTGSNYPLVQLTDGFGRVTYAMTSSWTTTQVGHNFESFQFTPPAGLASGDYALRVVASGIASDPVAYHFLSPSSPVLPLYPDPAPFGADNPDLPTAEAKGLYETILGRAADLGGLANSVAYLKSDGSLQTLASMLIHSYEYEYKAVASYYTEFLGRVATPAEIAGWVGYLERGHSEEQVTQLFLASKEYNARYFDDSGFVQSLYANMLGRVAVAAEVVSWVTAMRAGQSRVTVASDFVHSVEAARRSVEGLASAFWASGIDPADEQFVVAYLVKGRGSLADVAAAFANLPRFIERANETVA
jgi:hypothetical protein